MSACMSKLSVQLKLSSIFRALADDRSGALPYDADLADQRARYGDGLLKRAPEQLSKQEAYEGEFKARVEEARRARAEEQARIQAAEVSHECPGRVIGRLNWLRLRDALRSRRKRPSWLKSGEKLRKKLPNGVKSSISVKQRRRNGKPWRRRRGRRGRNRAISTPRMKTVRLEKRRSRRRGPPNSLGRSGARVRFRAIASLKSGMTTMMPMRKEIQWMKRQKGRPRRGRRWLS